MAYNPFGRLIKIEGAKLAEYNSAKVAGNLVFANLAGLTGDDTEKNGKYIWANGVEYKVADATDFDKLKLDVDSFAIDANGDSIRLIGKDFEGNDKVYATIGLADSDYISFEVATDGSIKASIKDGSLAKSTKDDYKDKMNLATEGYVLDKVAEATGEVEDLSTYVHEVVDASIDDLQQDLADTSSRLDNASTRMKDLVETVKFATATTDDIAKVTLTATKEDGTTADVDAFTVKGDEYVVVSTTDDASIKLDLNVVTRKEGIADSSTTSDSSVTSAYAVKEYVEDKLKGIVGAFVYRGTVATKEELPTDAKAGDVYVASAEFDIDGKHVEPGDMLFWNGESWGIVERNLTGAVTTNEEALEANKVILGNGNQTVKDSVYSIGTEDTHVAAANTLATELWVKDVVDNTSINAKVTVGENYIHAGQDADNNKIIDISIDVVADKAGLEAVTEAGQLVDAKAVKDYVDAAGGKLSAQDSATENAAEIDLTASATGSEVGGLGKITVKGVDQFVKVEGKEDEIDVSVAALSLNDASTGAVGLAIAKDVYDELTSVEKTMAEAINDVKDSVGLEDDLSIDWDGKFAEGTTVVDAIKDLSTDLDSLVDNIDKKISDAIDASIKNLDVDSTEVADKLLVGVSEADGKVASTAAEIWVNGNKFEHAANASAFVATIDSDDILVGEADGYAFDASTITEALTYIQDEIEEMGSDAVLAVEGDEVDPATPAQFVGVKATEDADHKVTLDSSLLVATDVVLSGGVTTKKATATGLATDKYVADYVSETLAWEVL